MIYDEKHVSFDTVNILLKSNKEQMYAGQIGYNVEAYECNSNDNKLYPSNQNIKENKFRISDVQFRKYGRRKNGTSQESIDFLYC